MENISTEIQENTNQQVLEIKTVDEMNNYLESLQDNASSSVSNALSAQLQVIRYVSSPDLTNSTFDLLFKNLDLSLKSAESEDERTRMRELSQLMIHNYIFFANAKLEYSITKNREAGKEVLKDATRELLKSSATVIKLAEENIKKLGGKLGDHVTEKICENGKSGVQMGDLPRKFAGATTTMTGTSVTAGFIAPIATAAAVIFVALVAADFIEKITKQDGLWDKAVDWAFAAAKNKRDKENFILTIDGIINKLDKYFYIIGKSNLMSDIIDRYSGNLITLKTKHLEDHAKMRSSIYKPTLVIVSIIGAIALSIIQLVSKGFSGVKNLIIKDASIVETHYSYYWFGLLSFVILGYLWISIPKYQLNSKIRVSEKRYRMLSQKFLEF
ncbi:hypothetical protein [Kaistella palustris]|uniref:hypothetical protein n=1 Tax=Kaistella palustris TaxID=493376 RepID=UPI0004053EF5|nr:hypothetical protein [Kaistella palustris]